MANNQVVTRDEFEAFLANPKAEGPLFDIPEEQRQLLFDVGKSVCKIVYKLETHRSVGSGFHLGNGWILTALHVISDEDTMGAEYVSQLTFQFPNEPVIEAASRSCIFPILPPKSAVAEVNSATAEVNSAAAEVNSAAAKVNSAAAKVNSAAAKVNSAAAKVNSAAAEVNSAATEVNSAAAEVNSAAAKVNSAAAKVNSAAAKVNSAAAEANSATDEANSVTDETDSSTVEVKDIALIHVPEVVERESIILGLGNPYQKPPQTGDCVHLVHFGGDHQQFSINGNVTLNQKVEQEDGGNSYSTFMAYSPSGSSGAPLLLYREDMKKFLVVGVHYEGPSTDDAGDALWFSRENWLKHTLRPAVDIVTKNRITSNVPEIVERHVNEVCEGLEEHLREHRLRVIINRPQPEFVKGVFEYVIFKP